MVIRAQELDNLLRLRGLLQETLKALKEQINRLKNDREDELIYDCMVKRNIDGMPRSRAIRDRTGEIAANLGQAPIKQRKAIQEVTAEINLIGTILDRLELAIRLLRPVEREIIYLRYDKELTFQQMAANTGMSKERIKQSYGQALERMSQTCGIQQNEYQKTLKIYERVGYYGKT
jgi:DNA-directed RNA polymerase specialized sigma24 family protein